jgi:hypothetical protein
MSNPKQLARRDDVATPIALLKDGQRFVRTSVDAVGGDTGHILVVLPPDHKRWVEFCKSNNSIVAMFEALLNHLGIHLSQELPTDRATAALCKLKLENWQRAIAWCLQLYLKAPLNAEPFNSREYKAFRKFGDVVYAQFDFLSTIFQAFETIDHPTPFFGKGFAGTFMAAVLEEINLGFTNFPESKEAMVIALRDDVALLKAKQNIYDGTVAPTNHLILQVAFNVMPPNPKDNNEVKSGRLKVRKAYQAMLKALESYTTQIRTDPNRYGLAVAFAKDGDVYQRKKRVKGRSATRRRTQIPVDLKNIEP